MLPKSWTSREVQGAGQRSNYPSIQRQRVGALHRFWSSCFWPGVTPRRRCVVARAEPWFTGVITQAQHRRPKEPVEQRAAVLAAGANWD